MEEPTNPTTSAIECVVKCQLCLDGLPGGERLHDMRRELSLTEHIEFLHAAFGGTSKLGAAAADLALWLPSLARFLASDEWDSGSAHRRFWILEGTTLELRRAPHALAAEAIRRLQLPAEVIDEVEDVCRELAHQLVETQFSLAFIQHGGVDILLDLSGRIDQPRVQEHALAALHVAIAFQPGIDRLLALDGTTQLLRLTFGTNMYNSQTRIWTSHEVERYLRRRRVCARFAGRAVRTVALEILALLGAHEDGFRVVHGAAIVVSREQETAAYAQLVQLIECCEGHMDLRSAALLLLNQLLASAPSVSARSTLLGLLYGRLELDEVLSCCLLEADAPFIDQLRLHEEVTGKPIPGSWSEARRLQTRCESLRVALAESHAGLKPYRQQQALQDELLAEIERFRQAVCRTYDGSRQETPISVVSSTKDDNKPPMPPGGRENELRERLRYFARISACDDETGVLAKARAPAAEVKVEAETPAEAVAEVGLEDSSECRAGASRRIASRVADWASALAEVEELQFELSMALEKERKEREKLEASEILLQWPPRVEPLHSIKTMSDELTGAHCVRAL